MTGFDYVSWSGEACRGDSPVNCSKTINAEDNSVDFALWEAELDFDADAIEAEYADQLVSA